MQTIQEFKEEFENISEREGELREAIIQFMQERLEGTDEDNPKKCNIKLSLVNELGDVYGVYIISNMYKAFGNDIAFEEQGNEGAPVYSEYWHTEELIDIASELEKKFENG